MKKVGSIFFFCCLTLHGLSLRPTAEDSMRKALIKATDNEEKIRICVEDAFSIKDGHPTFNKKWTDPMPAKAFASELIKHTYRNGWSLPAMPA